MLDLLDEILRRSGAGEPLAVCTLVRTRGSTPQKAGAVLVVLQDGRTLGTIGGGCVEAEVRKRALQILAEEGSAEPHATQLHTFQLDHDFGWDDGLVCGGTMDVAIQRITSPEQAEPLRQVRDQIANGDPATITIVTTDSAGNESRFERELLPSPALLIVGAGHVGAALAIIARQFDFRVTVLDDRADLAVPDRLGGARCIVGPVEAQLAKVRIDAQTYIVIVTRGHQNDAKALAAVVRSNANYIGLIGSKRKIITIFEELRQTGVPRELLERVHAPIGLDIGAVTPAEIAVSIAAEIVAVRRGKAGGAALPMRLSPTQLLRALED